MIRTGLATVFALAITACTTTPTTSTTAVSAPASAEEALALYYDTIPDSALPKAPEGLPLPAADTVLTRILVASCNNEENASPALATIASTPADLLIMMGDNVYGDMDGRAYKNNDPDLGELKESYAEFATRPEFIAARSAVPMIAVWDDHDYGANDGGREFPFRRLAERMHEVFWDVPADVQARPGVYDSYIFGPEGQRTQIIMLDTRFFRSPLTPTDEYGKAGKERYIPSSRETEQDMLGSAQWEWLEAELKKPAEVRLLVSSIQVTPTVHGWEAWSTMPQERERLFQLIMDTEAKGVVFISGDRHTAFIYRNSYVIPYPAYELTSSSLNASFATESSEVDEFQVGPAYALTNFGDVLIDWEAGGIALRVLSESGEPVREITLTFQEIGLR